MIFLQSALIHYESKAWRVRQFEEACFQSFGGWRDQFTAHCSIFFCRGNGDMLDKEIWNARGQVNGSGSRHRSASVPRRNCHIVRLGQCSDTPGSTDAENSYIRSHNVD